PLGPAGDGTEASAPASCVSGACAGSSERFSVVSVKPEISMFSVTGDAESVAESDAALSITKRAASASSGSSMVMVTSARPRGGRLVVPLKMQSAMRSARSDLWLCSPRTQEMASTTLYSSGGGSFERQVNLSQVACQNVWQVLSQRPSRLAQGWRYGRKQ